MNKGIITQVDRIDDLVYEFYENLDSLFLKEKPEYRFLLLSPLLNKLCNFNLANNVRSFNELFTKDNVSPISQLTLASEICSSIQSIIGEPSYFAASYWSPIDRKRHTISHSKAKPTIHAEHEARVCALLFYILTYKAHPIFHSAINYIATESPRKDGLHSIYLEEDPYFNIPIEKQYQIWWHLPKSIHERLLYYSGFSTTLKELEKIDSIAIENSLTIIMENLDEENVNNEIKKYDELVLPIIEKAKLFSIPEDIEEWVDKFENYLNNFFYPSHSNHSDKKKLTATQCFYMASTHALYNKACPTKMFYTFPVRVSDTCCVLTLGVDKELELEKILAMSHIVKSIYYHGLVRDYDAKNALERNRLAHGAVHILSGPLIIFKQIKDIIRRSLRPNLTASEFQKIDNILAPRFWDFEKAFASMSYGVEFLSQFVDYEQPVDFNLNEIIKESIRMFSNGLYEVLDKIEYSSEYDNPLTFGIPSHTKFIFGELIYNSIRAFRHYYKNDNKKLNISISIKSNDTYFDVFFCDNGIGIEDAQKDLVFKSGYTGKDSGGSGKGLFLSKLFLKTYKGDITEIGNFTEGVIFKLSFLKSKNI
jgi:hypothetical protein